MPKFILRFLALSALCTGAAFGQSVQGTFAQIAYGGSWQTTFTLVNLNSSAGASVTLNFFGDGGSPLSAPVDGAGSLSSYTFTIPPNGARNIVLSSTDTSVTQGWASMVTSGIVRGQGSFRFVLANGQISEAVVPLTTPGVVAGCIIPIPQTNPLILIPFDNTSGYVTSLAVANITTNAPSYAIEFVDQSNNPLVADTLNLSSLQHKAFVTTQAYPAVAGKKGIIRIHGSTADLSLPTVLGLLSNSTNTVTTIIPITQ